MKKISILAALLAAILCFTACDLNITIGNPGDTSGAADTSSPAPESTSQAPDDTTSAHVETTSAPVDTTSAPVDTTSAPVDTTSAPAVTTSSPDVTKQPEVTTGPDTPPVGTDKEATGNGITVVGPAEHSVSTMDMNGTFIFILSQDGEYTVSGTATGNVQIAINSEGKNMLLYFNGVTINNTGSVSPLEFLNASSVKIVAEADSYIGYKGDPQDISTPCIRSVPDLTFSGNAKFEVGAEYGHGILCDGDVRVDQAGDLIVKSTGGGISSEKSITIVYSRITVDADYTALLTLGYTDKNIITIRNAHVDLKGGLAGIQGHNVLIDGAATDLVIINKSNDVYSCIYATNLIEIYDGDITLDGWGDGILSVSMTMPDGSESPGNTDIHGGKIHINASGCDIVGTTVSVYGGNIELYDAQRGISADVVHITNGRFDISSAEAAIRGESYVSIDGGEIRAYVSGTKSPDIHGSVYTQTGGTVILETKVANGMFGATMKIQGGVYVSLGETNVIPDITSRSVQLTGIAISPVEEYRVTCDGNVIVAFSPVHGEYSECIISSPSLAVGKICMFSYKGTYEDGTPHWVPIAEWIQTEAIVKF